MIADLGFREGRSLLGLINDEPLRPAFRGGSKNEFSIRTSPAKVFDVGASQTVPAHKAITRFSRPTAFERQGPDSAAQRQLTSVHRRRAAAKTVHVLSFDLYACAS